MRPFDVLHEAAQHAAATIPARESDGSFLEETLRSALMSALPGITAREQPLGLTRWSTGLGGVDIEWWPADAAPVGIETKVSDASDCLFDVLKLASAVAEDRIKFGVVAVAATSRAWQKPGVIPVMAQALPAGATSMRWKTSGLLASEADRWSWTWSQSRARPMAVPRAFSTSAAPPIALPLANDHELRLILVTDADLVAVAMNDDGQAGAELIEHAYFDDDPQGERQFVADTMAVLEERVAAAEQALDPKTLGAAAAIYYGDDPPHVKLQRLRDEIGQTEESMGYCSSLLRQFPRLLSSAD